MQNCSGELSALIQVVNEILPRLNGRVAPAEPSQLQCDADGNPDRIAAFLEYLRWRFPEAGAHYWTIRAWSLLIWQPIYLSVLSVHHTGQAPCLDHLAQSCDQGLVGGFNLPDHTPATGSVQTVIAYAANQLRSLLERQLAEFNTVSEIYPKLARLLAADSVRAALLMAQRERRRSNTWLRVHELEWMRALGISPGSSLIEVPMPDGQCILALGRKVCCQHFRRDDGEYCSTCPKLKPAQRQERLRQDFAVED